MWERDYFRILRRIRIHITVKIFALSMNHQRGNRRLIRFFVTDLTMANVCADGISLDLKSDFAAIAATRPPLHLELIGYGSG
jgi:hypothetical protein